MSAGPPPTAEPPAARNLRVAAEAVLLGLVVLAPWPFASVTTPWAFVLLVGVALLTGLWAAHACLTRRLSYHPDLPSACLLGIVLLTAAQLVPLPGSVVRVLSPQAAEWHRVLIPASPEVLPGESEATVPRRPDWFLLSIDPAATRDFLVQVVAVFLVYAVTRNLVASKESFRRLAVVGFAVGVGLAVLALAQAASGARSTIYGRYTFVNQVFGPFVNKNHYSFFVNLCGGLGLGLLLLTLRDTPVSHYRPGIGDYLRSPRVVGLLAGLGLMLGSIPLSLSRGGLLATVSAVGVTAAVGLVRRRRGGRGVRVWPLAAGAAVVAVGIVAWLGWTPMGTRLGEGENRTPLWREVWPIAEKFPTTGVGGGALPRAEQAFRTRTVIGVWILNSVANEYLEALIEGGVLRLALTLVLAGSLLWLAATGARRLRRRTVGPLLLGSVFGLTAVVVHSAVDFGIHMPAVALLAAVVAGQVTAARGLAGEPNSATPSRTREGREGRRPDLSPASRGHGASDGSSSIPTYVAATVLAAVGLLVAWWGWQAVQVERLHNAADGITRTAAPNRWDRAVAFLEAATRIRPDDAELWSELSAVHLAAAQDQSLPPFLAVVGPPAAVNPPDVFNTEAIREHVLPALRAARTARDRNPLLSGPHLRLATYARLLARSEPVSVHLDRAERMGRSDPDVWFLAGRAALAAGDTDRAWSDWKESLRRSQRRLGAVVQLSSAVLLPDQLRTRVLPDDPAVWVAVTDLLYPNPTTDPEGRRAWLRAAADRWASAPPDTPEGMAAWATVLEDLAEPALAEHVWRMAAEKFPESELVRDRLAAGLEAEELYEEAVPLLEWLAARSPSNRRYHDRLEAARHALTLKRQIEAPE